MNCPPLHSSPPAQAPAAATLALEYVNALGAANGNRLDALQSADFVLDVMCGRDASAGPLMGAQSHQFWPAWLAGFSSARFHVQSLHAAYDEPDSHGSAVLVQWLFSGIHSGLLKLPVWRSDLPPTHQPVCVTGISTYGVQNGVVARETTFIDMDRSQFYQVHAHAGGMKECSPIWF